MGRAVVGFGAVTLSIVALASAAHATPGGGEAVTDGDGEIVSVETLPLPGDAPASPDGYQSDKPAGSEHPVAAADPTPPCAQADLVTSEVSADPDGNLIYTTHDPPKCVSPLTCGRERIDSFFTGELSGGGHGAYHAYLQQVINAIGHQGPGLLNADVDVIKTAILDTLGDPPTEYHMATFWWCRHGPDGAFELADPIYGPSFSWDTTIESEYPIDSVRDDLTTRVIAAINIYEPELAAVPPVNTDHTFVKWPTWFWIQDALTEIDDVAHSDLGVLEVAVRANLLRIEFTIGDTDLTCTPDQMLAYDPDIHHPIDDVPECHHIFTETGDHDYLAVLFYEIEERIRQRRHPTLPWPDVPWGPHPTWTAPYARSSDPCPYGVHQLIAINVAREIEVTETTTTCPP